MVNPYTIYKSRTGGVLSRLLTRTALDLVGGIMFAPGKEFVDEFASAIVTAPDADAEDRQAKERIRDYVRENYAPDAQGRRNRFMALLFEGEDAVRRTRAAVGNIKGHSLSGETIRDTYGDFIQNRDGSVRHFEPAVLAAPTPDDARRQMGVLAKFADSDAGLLDEVARTHGEAGHERTLVILKPDNFRFPSGRPGNVIDLLSRAGLTITGIKVHRMSVAEAEQFYGPVRPVLLKAFTAPTGHRAKELVVSALALPINAETEGKLAELLGPLAAEEQFQNIVRFMAGRAPRDCTPDEKAEAGSEKCIVLVYEGIDAVRKIREVLGPTDPSKAPPGSIRREFGQTMMVNAAHASDSPENAERELAIVKIERNNFKSLIQQAYGL